MITILVKLKFGNHFLIPYVAQSLVTLKQVEGNLCGLGVSRDIS